ncbi:MAG: hypothetical protein ABL985_08940 [Casimicrobium sp.]
MTNTQTSHQCPMCNQSANVARIDGDTKLYVLCTSGAEFLIGDNSFGQLKRRPDVLKAHHELAKARKPKMVYAMLRGDGNATHSQAVTGFRTRSLWL